MNRKRYAYNIEVITKAKVPIIRFTDSVTSISIDLSCNNLLGTVNSQLINCYRQFDERVHILGIALKAVLKHYGILGSGNGLSSYGYILMLIAFLQNTSPPVVRFYFRFSLIYRVLLSLKKTLLSLKKGQVWSTSALVSKSTVAWTRQCLSCWL